MVLRISDDVPNRSVIVTTCLTLVVVTTIFFGSTVGLLGKCLFDKVPEAGALEEEEDKEDVEQLEDELDDAASYAFSDSESSKSSLREKLIHYNEKDADSSSTSSEEDKKKKKRKTTCAGYLRRIDELIMRPIFIYHYEKDMHNKAREFYDLFMHDGEKIEEQFE